VLGTGPATGSATATERTTTMTHTISAMMASSPAGTSVDQQLLAECIQACVECAQTCTACADACLSEDSVAELTRCISTDLDCADVCDATGRVLTRLTGRDLDLTRAVLLACAQACKSCGDECAQHAEMHEHCRLCAEACRRCEEACNKLLAAL
jgi:hypothetical protein